MRLELSSRTDLALRAMRRLDRADGRMARVDLAADLGTTPDFLARVMAPLVRAGWVESQRGKSGGYQLAPSAAVASVLDVIVAQEGVPADGRCVLRSGPCDPEKRCELHEPWTKARDAMLGELGTAPALEPRGGIR